MNTSRIFGISGASLLFAGILLAAIPVRSEVPICGNAKVEGLEECDNGQNNSDEGRDACRSNCVKASCGDGTVDTGEECDWGHYNPDHRNNNQVPNACRPDCKKAHCGDGVLDAGEECDDANSDGYDGCNQCMKCYAVKDNLVLSAAGARLKLCPGKYESSDSGQEGVLVLTGDGMVLDCNGASIIGMPMDLAGLASAKAQTPANVMVNKPGMAKTKAGNTKQTQPPATPAPVTPKPPATGPVAQLLSGVGIVVQARDVVLHNCVVEKFKTGISLKSTGAILFNNRVCGNTKDIVSAGAGNFGLKNACANPTQWQENGVPTCMLGCGN